MLIQLKPQHLTIFELELELFAIEPRIVLVEDRWRVQRYPYRLICLIYVLHSFLFVILPMSGLFATNSNDSALFFQLSEATLHCCF